MTQDPQTDVLRTEIARLRLEIGLLRKSEELFRSAAQSSLDAQLILYGVRSEAGPITDYIFADMNQRAEQMFHFSTGEALGRRLLDIYPEAGPEFFLPRFAAVQDNGVPLEVEYRIDDEATGIEWLQLQITPMKLGVAVSMRDVTERKRTEETIRKHEANYREIFTKANDAILVHDATNGRVLDANDAAVELFGYRREELLEGGIRLLASDEETDIEQAFSGFNSDSAPVVFEWQCRARDGRALWVEVNLKPAQIAGHARILSMIHDVTERKQLEERFLHSQKMEAFGRLAGGVAHDFNNLLSIIIGRSELIADLPEPNRDAFVTRNIDEIRSTAERAAALTQQLLAFSRKQVLQTRVIDLDLVVSDARKMTRRLIGEDVQLQFARAKESVFIKADPGQIEQVVMNLAVNARDAMPGGGTLFIEVSAESSSEVLLRVRDTGCGMDERTRTQAFEPFFTTKERGRGTGLGLSTVYGIVEQSGGRIEIDTRVGEGTEFRIWFPRTAEVQITPPQGQPAPARSRRGSGTVLVVEDDHGVRDMMKDLLEDSGFDVIEADRPEHAIRLMGEYGTKIVAIVSDVVMPTMSGPKLVSELRRVRPDLKALFVSGYTDDALERSGGLAPGDEFLQKPFRKTQFLESLDRLLQPKRA